METKIIELPLQFREVQIRQGDIDIEKRTVNLTFSSETPVERFWGTEILDHSPDSVMLERLRTAGPLLLMHDRSKQIGKVSQVSIGEDRRGHAVVKFGRSAMAQEIFQDVQDGIRDTVSVGYMIHEAKLEETGDTGDIYRVNKWEPFEISLEPTPADINVGVGRQADDEKKFQATIMYEERSSKNMDQDKKIEPQNPPAPPAIDVDKEIEKIATKELNRIEEISVMGEKFNMKDEARKAIKERKTVDQFRQEVLNKIDSVQHIDTQQANLGMTAKDIRNYSILRGIQAILLNKPELAGLEMEASREITKRFQKEPQGFYVPHDVLLRELPLVGKNAKREITTSGASGLVSTDHLAGSFIDLLRNRAVMAQLGMRILSGLVGNVSIPKQSSAATGYWVAESGNVTASDSGYSALTLSLKTVGAATPYTRAMLLQSNPSIEALVMDDIAQVLALAIDLAAIDGLGTSNQPTGILNTSGIGAVTGSSLAWAGVVEFETDVAAANGDIGSMAYLTNATIRGILKTRERASNTARFLMENGEMNGYPVVVSNQVPSATMIFGVFSQIILGLWGGLDIWPDPYTSAADGGVYIRAFQSCDIGVRQAAAFSASEDID